MCRGGFKIGLEESILVDGGRVEVVEAITDDGGLYENC